MYFNLAEYMECTFDQNEFCPLEHNFENGNSKWKLVSSHHTFDPNSNNGNQKLKFNPITKSGLL